MNQEKPRKRETFEEWFNRQGIRNFKAHEFTEYFKVKRRGASNSEPPREYWPRILPALRLADDARDHFGRACVILSSYRSPAYNSPISGAASKSQHLQFTALDLAFAGVTPSRVFDYFMARRNAGDFKGGLGLYGTFTHIDCRGYNATWTGN